MSKTPVSILQELLMQRKGIPPQYELLPSEGVGTHLPTFHYRVIAETIVAEGKARSKKEAKHEAAKNALEKLCTIGIYYPTHVATPPVSSSPLFTPNHLSPVHIQVNAIGALQDLCSENNIPQPEFQLKADIGPAHLRHFTIECRIATIVATATELTKKKAKQHSAQIMLHRLMDTLPEVIAELKVSETSNMLALKSEDIQITYNELSKKKTNWGLKISSYPYSLKTIMTEKNINTENLWQSVHNRDEVDLSELLNKLDLQFSSELIENDENTIACITIDSQPIFTVAEISEIKEEAYYGAIQKCFVFLEIMTK